MLHMGLPLKTSQKLQVFSASTAGNQQQSKLDACRSSGETLRRKESFLLIYKDSNCSVVKGLALVETSNPINKQ